MTLDDALKHLAAECYAAGGQAKWARTHGFSPGFVSAVLTKRKPPSEKILAALRLERVVRTTVTYRRLRGE